MRRKRIFLNKKKTRYCTVKLFDTKLEMQKAYKKFRFLDKNHEKVLGVHCGYTRYDKDNKLSHETGIVFLSKENCGAGVVTHELMHAILWAHKHTARKQQYPILIKNMIEEEVILHAHTGAVTQFYNWFFDYVK